MYNDIKTKLKKMWNDDPFATLFVTGILLGGTAKVLNAVTARKNAHTWEREVDRRRMK